MMDDERDPAFRGTVSLVLLFSDEVTLEAHTLASMLRAFDDQMANAEAEVMTSEPSDARTLVARFAGHLVLFRISNGPLVEAFIEPTIQLGHYDADSKDRARAHRTAITIEYLGTCDPPLIAYVAVAAAAGALAPLGASVIANVRARTSVPAGLVSKCRDEMIDYLAALPPLLLFAGFAKYSIERVDGIWMRTHGNRALALPDFAHHAKGHEDGHDIFTLFCDMMLYLLESGARMSPGDVAQIGEDRFTLLREPTADEAFLDQSDGSVLVVEVLDHEELMRARA